MVSSLTFLIVTTAVVVALAVVLTSSSLVLIYAQTPSLSSSPPQQEEQAPKIDDIYFSEDGTGWLEFNWINLTDISAYTGNHQLRFNHNMTVANGYEYDLLPQECLSLGHRAVSKVYYPWGERVNPNTLNLSRVITQITVVPAGLVLPDEIKISSDTSVVMEGAGQILRPEEDEKYYQACGYVSNAQEEEILNRLK